ncbi:MAG: hypothetical protein JHC33_07010 [Ignisphaera sp.]|nr:hypothetical protein [Ignisphaera sp.]
MTFKEINNGTEKMSGVYEIRGTTFTDGGNTFYYAWEVSFVNETLQDFIDITQVNPLSITGIRRLGDNE